MVFEGQCERLIANLHLEEGICRPHYLSVIDGSNSHPTGDTIGDAIRRVA